MTTKTYELLLRLKKLHPRATRAQLKAMCFAEIKKDDALVTECLRQCFEEDLRSIKPEWAKQ